ncbi:NusB antitermination factor [Thermodesulfatator indicus DSM 15286]|uniref:Transcription antitermination protein NusB n=1 Tax=Thermodesulfatator indicus (strain DSM 15286 / JCM 11887 / CIR29812) TaxID=667014 RepID=F8AC99_THEID|nr:transcription antitermination factor NusB [Thermodesulfatator indicus]AEH45734.1 NusB antitermination factor [Thermodesulfatator indicus DSM 15286]
MGLRRKAREIAVQILYQADVAGVPFNEAFATYEGYFNPSPKVLEFAKELVNGVAEKQEEIDKIIEKYAKHWKLSRMSATDRNILRLATYELLYRPDIPERVSINEAIELAKSFGSDESASFVNGILDAIYRHECRKTAN